MVDLNWWFCVGWYRIISGAKATQAWIIMALGPRGHNIGVVCESVLIRLLVELEPSAV